MEGEGNGWKNMNHLPHFCCHEFSLCNLVISFLYQAHCDIGKTVLWPSVVRPNGILVTVD